MVKTAKDPADYILPLYINGLEGRMLRVPPSTKRQREILFVYGHHAMLERWWSLVETLREFGYVTMPDLPGFGGMDSFFKIGMEPDIDAYADYLASFIKLRYKQKRVTILGISYGFVIVTRMLQRYPELAKKVDVLVGIVGFMHKDDFLWTPRTRILYRYISLLLSTRPVAFCIRHIALNKLVVKFLTKHLGHSKHRFIETNPAEFDATMDFDVKLWKVNDVRTHWLTTSQFFTLDNTEKPVALPVVHVVSQGEHYFNNVVVEHHMRMVFTDYKRFFAKTGAHTPHITADKKTTAALLPLELRRMLRQETGYS